MDITSDAYDIRYSQHNDTDEIAHWLHTCPVTKQAFSVIEEAEIASLMNMWRSYMQYRASLTATWKDQVIGVGLVQLFPYIKTMHNAMLLFVVNPQFRRQGVGKSLLRNLVHHAKHHFHLEGLHVEVFGKNPGYYLLKNQGFSELFIQENYIDFDGNRYPRICMERRDL